MLKTGIFANRWWIVVGALLGLAVNTGVIEVFTFSVFLKPISQDLGFQRETIALAGVFGSLCATVATPLFGKGIDHFGLRIVFLPMVCLYALATAMLSLLSPSFAIMVAFFCFRGIVGSGQSPIAYSKAIAAWFDKDRGLALGIAIAGVGIGVAIMPLIATHLIAAYGWRPAFVGLGGAIILRAGVSFRARTSATQRPHRRRPFDDAGGHRHRSGLSQLAFLGDDDRVLHRRGGDQRHADPRGAALERSRHPGLCRG